MLEKTLGVNQEGWVSLCISFLHLRNSRRLSMDRLPVQLLTVMMQRSRKGERTVKERTEERRRNCGKQKTKRT